MTKTRFSISALLLAASLLFLYRPASAAPPAIVIPEDGSPREILAAREVMRYLYLRTGVLAPIVTAQKPPQGEAILISRKDRPLVAAAADAETTLAMAGLMPQQFLLKTVVRRNGHKLLLVAGGDDVGTLYGAYRLAECLGIRFYLHGDVVPDGRIPLVLPQLSETNRPLFNLRGIQPFHDFGEGPDWWGTEDYKAIITQLPKLRMNFIGLHTYPERNPVVGPEATVWIGRKEDVGAQGGVRFSYPSGYMTTKRGWRIKPMRTSEFTCGADQLFAGDDFGSEALRGYMSWPEKPEDCNEVFNRTGTMLQEAFTWARELGVKTCVGTEVPLSVPKRVAERLKELGQDASDPAVVRALYEGMFLRIIKQHPLDYYWLWTDERWTWSGAPDDEVQTVERELRLAWEAARAVKAPFTVATCGWVLGPPRDRAQFARTLPKDMPFSCINRNIGKDPVEPQFATIQGRPKWAIPWLEDDGNLIGVQLWADRMCRDAVDARRYGCNGLMGIHWRTQVLGPNVAALAGYAWRQPAAETLRSEGPEDGQFAQFLDHPMAGTSDAALYQHVRFDVSGYHFKLPNDKYAVTLKFCEPAYTNAGRRVFGVKLQGQTVIDTLDIFATAGPNRALDYTFREVAVTNGWLDLNFVRQVEYPCIAAIAIEGPSAVKKVNCGGPPYKDYVADWPAGVATKSYPSWTADFYLDWARANFGPGAAAAASAVFQRLDGHMPEPSEGIGQIRRNATPWDQEQKRYAFVDELAGLRSLVQSPGNLERFDYWLNTFSYLRAMARLGCTLGRLDALMAAAVKETDPIKKQQLAREQALPLRCQIPAQWQEMMTCLLATVGSPGELGTVSDLEQVAQPGLGLESRYDTELKKILGEPLPAQVEMSKVYRGPPRIIVPTARTLIEPGESFALNVMLLGSNQLAGSTPTAGELFWRPLGKGKFARVPLTHVARSVYEVKLPPFPRNTAAIEYYIRATNGPTMLLYPPTAPTLNQTVVVSKWLKDQR